MSKNGTFLFGFWMISVQKSNSLIFVWILDVRNHPKMEHLCSVFGCRPNFEPSGLGKKLNVREPNMFGFWTFTVYVKIWAFELPKNGNKMQKIKF